MAQDEDTSEVTTGGLSRRAFLTGSAVAAIGASALVNTVASAAPLASAKLKAGAGKAVIDVASVLPLDGFGEVHDDIYARVLLVENGSTKAAIVVLDMTSVGADSVSGIRTAVNSIAGVDPDNIIVTVTHCFSAPHAGGPPGSPPSPMVALIVAAATAAVTDAFKGLKSAKVGYGYGKSDVNVNRNVHTADGYWLGTNESLPSDKTVGVTRIDDLSGTPIAILTNYNVQSCVMQDSVQDNGLLPVTADLAGAVVSHVESQYADTGVIGFWLVGACGDQFPAYRSKRYTIDKDGNWYYGIDIHDAGFNLLTVQGERLGTEVVRVAQAITAYDRKPTLKSEKSAIQVTTTSGGMPSGPVTSFTFTPTGKTDIPIWILELGDAAFAGMQPELSTSTAMTIRADSPFKYTFVMSMLDGGAKNMPDRFNFEHLTYEALDGFYAEGSAERAARKIHDLLESL